jgi:lysophospholipase L1-like esterase
VKQITNPKSHLEAFLPDSSILTTLFRIGWLLVIILPFTAYGQVSDNKPLELKNGDRVVFLGNALMENEQVYNFLEFHITRHWPERNITFRNLGWSGDNVFGEARSYYTSPPSAYDLLISQLTDAKPTHVLLAYGSVEAQDGESGLEKFGKGLEKLIDKIQELGAEPILLSPTPQFSGGTPSLLAERNKNLNLYAEKIAQIAQSYQKRYVDLYSPFEQITEKGLLSENGLHLTEYGYYRLAGIIEEGLGLGSEPRRMLIDAKSGEIESSLSTNLIRNDSKTRTLEFLVEEKILPVPIPNSPESLKDQLLSVKGLKKGVYSLEINGKLVASASAKAWAEGIPLLQGGTLDQADHLKRLLNKKDEVFFFQYRPLNRTYIIGFREYEQGRHVKDLEDFDIVLTWLQGQITAAKSPAISNFKLYPTP